MTLASISGKVRGSARRAPKFLDYCLVHAGPHCRFIRKSVDQDLLYASIYSLEELRSFSAEKDAAESLFFVSLDHVERFRRDRANLPPISRLLICDNIVIPEPTGEDPEALKKLLGWPHWMLKCLYSNKGIMFGKFWRGEEMNTDRGERLFPPTQTFISIRTAILDRDLQFVDNSEYIGHLLEHSFDDGKSPLPDGGSVETLTSLDAPARSQAYASLKAWAEKILHDQKAQ